MRDPLPSPIPHPMGGETAPWTWRNAERHGRGLVLLVLVFCWSLLLLICGPATAATNDLDGPGSFTGPRGTPIQQLDDEAMPELQLFARAGADGEDELLPPLGSMASQALGGDLLGE